MDAIIIFFSDFFIHIPTIKNDDVNYLDEIMKDCVGSGQVRIQHQ